jgi:hypothetical protein
MFCVSPCTVQQWRHPRYANSPLRLEGVALDSNTYLYPMEVLEAFVARHPRFHPLLNAGRARLPGQLSLALQRKLERHLPHAPPPRNDPEDRR